jgi:hypothetical protein
MSYNPIQPVKTRQMINRYHLHRRKQLLLFAGISLLAIILAGGGLWLYLYFSAWDRSVAPTGGGRPSTKRRARQYARIAAVYEFNPAPWLLATDDALLYVGLDSTLVKPNAPPWPVDTLQAYAANSAKPLWEWKQQHEFHWFTAASGMFFGMRQYLGNPPGFELTAFNGQDGQQAWQERQAGAEDCILVVDNKVAIIAYYQTGTYRIIGYNPVTGAKAWVDTLKPSSRGSQDSAGAGNELELAATQGVVTYRLGNRCGVIANGTGEHLREVSAKGYVYLIEYDSTSKMVYIVSKGAERQTYLMQAVPLSGGAVDLCRFTSSGDNLLLLGEQGYAMLGYPVPQEAGAANVQKVVCFAAGSAQPQMSVEYSGRVVWDMVALPTMPGEFLITLCQGVDNSGNPSGECELRRLRVAGKSEWLLQRLPQPAELWPFKDDCLVLEQGGDLLSYRGTGKLKRLKHLEYPNLEMQSMTSKRLVLGSYPEAYLTGQPGQPMQVVVLE